MEQRKYPRHSIRGTLMAAIRNLIRPGTDGDNPIRATVMDLSREGAGLSLVVISSRPYQVGDSIQIDIELPDASTVASDAEVKWTKPLPEQIGHYLGVQFTQISDGERVRLNKYLDEINEKLDL